MTTVFDNQNSASPIISVEFSPTTQGNLSFYYVSTAIQRGTVKQWLTTQAGQEIIAETKVDGHTVFVARGDKTQEDILKLLADHGDTFAPHTEKKGVDLWKLRGIASVVGQSLQIFSAATQLKQVDPSNPTRTISDPKDPNAKWVHKGVEGSMMMFAVLNMGANVFNYVFGSQKSPDADHLHYLKDQANRTLAPHVQPGQDLLDANKDDRVQERSDQQKKPKAEGLSNFLKRHSVVIGEIGMRYVAAIGLVIPMSREGKLFGGWGNFAKNIGKGNLKKAWHEGKNPKEKLLHAGELYLVGKFLALFTKVKDPYEHKQHTIVDTIREDVLFKVGSLIEAGAGSMIAYNGYSKNNIGLKKTGEKIEYHEMIGEKSVLKSHDVYVPKRDYPAAVGGSIFAMGYLIRFGAKFGEKQLDMKELQAHLSDSIARTNEAERPQLLADTVAAVKNDLKDKELKGKKVTFGQLFTPVLTDLWQHNNVTLGNLAGSPDEQRAKMNAITNTGTYEAKIETPATEVHEAKIVQMNPQHTPDIIKPAASHVEAIAAQTPSELGIGA